MGDFAATRRCPNCKDNFVATSSTETLCKRCVDKPDRLLDANGKKFQFQVGCINCKKSYGTNNSERVALCPDCTEKVKKSDEKA